jgi:hypothetical protein
VSQESILEDWRILLFGGVLIHINHHDFDSSIAHSGDLGWIGT